MGNKITKDLQTFAVSLRMQPLEGVFQRLDRVARDVARAQGKKIQVIRIGVDVNLDKAVIERITEPLIHIIRNAVDHGLEAEDERRGAGKTDDAMLQLIGRQEAGGVTIQVKDNGRGLDADKVLARAVQQGLVSPDARLSKNDINNLIMLPGFSTAEKITDISGRGVGMDVVKTAVEELNGKITIESEKGKGTTFKISLPTSLSIVDALVVLIDGVRYAVPMQDLSEVVDLADFVIEKSSLNDRMISLRGEVVPLEQLVHYLPALHEHKLFGKKKIEFLENIRAHREIYGTKKLGIGNPALIVASGADKVAFEIDGIVGQQQVFVRKLSAQLAALPGLSGGTILADGEPGMIISLPSVARSYLKNARHEEAIL
jgi:two-component system chemotaxis sensor kinase CheA